ncbi:DMT family transporter [Actinomycetospora endophytica]|uniref:DMT family transporter n=1 Tax=Actinomycetospora endophytica TaxID=2291215 RepID=A0ABS8PA77_9PSEU|nr:DMT family transporter [Actinomycetospora endophytica]MCD2195123.1 DMT family transporter [Actinomycetospora endophytica]
MTALDACAAGLALLAALLFAVASVVQRGAAAAVPDEAARGSHLVGRLVRSRRWWAGAGADTGAFGLQAGALGIGSVLLVQPLLVTTLLFALPLEARYSGRTVTTAQRQWSVALVGALALFVCVGQPTAGVDRAPFAQWVPAGSVLVLVAAACVLGAGRRRGARRAALLAVAVGLAYGLVGALTKSVVALLATGLVPLLRGWETWVLLAAIGIGTLLQQIAFGAGPLSASLPAVTVGEPLGASLLGVVVLGEHIRASGPTVVLIVLLVAVMAVATAALARGSVRAPAVDSTVG